MSRTPSARNVVSLLENWSPKHLAMEGDPVGLMLGSLDKSVENVLVTLDVTEAVVAEAVEKGADLIISHHPLLFMPLTEVDTTTPKGRVIQQCLRHDITVYAAHTNLDITTGGMNDWMAAAMGIKETEEVVPTKKDQLYKLVAFVPEEDTDQVRRALGDAGAGHIGDYSHCTFNSEGTGTFIPGDETDPHIGNQGELTFVPERKIETVVPDSKLSRVLDVLADAHPYEEPAYDLYPLSLEGESFGLGRIGTLASSVQLDAFATSLKEIFNVEGLRVVGDLGRKVQNIAVIGGDGSKFWQQALAAGADVLVTGDVKFHTAQDAEASGLALIDPGHHTEAIMKQPVADRLAQDAEASGYQMEVNASDVNTEPFTFL
ncbi:Nif3-like dinuclear metal center hexameric protein [Salicibibacter halophilus]|uniref:GTP cyclohydrolase 1 type 2 homolog n=1 Tax=Salicibibacter halophilus TaxID=2502791 RepID=A0A514LD65_9BACI|nr:Nif3-like dinuclear metal center hexameric protein [Salicibibacter halophilus]QDI89792.1 Nif3-like dinuclear metal center hexameric protein [Salicibibacter halophilus]